MTAAEEIKRVALAEAIDLDALREGTVLVGYPILPLVRQLAALCEGEAGGYVLESKDRSWRALFGYYTPTLQPPEVIPRQVQCLRWLLASEERKLETVRLALSEETCGTFTKFG